MSLTLGIVTETAPSEARVAATPDSVRKWAQMGCTTILEPGAGARAGYMDAAYQEAGAQMASRADILSHADILLTLQPPPAQEIAALKSGAVLVGFMNGADAAVAIAAAHARGVTVLAMEGVPRISRAQAMDALSSQSSLAGYRAVIEAAAHFGRAFPMMMTAAGTIPPAKVFVMGAGVAGLQAIATARRMGAAVSATDVRAAAGEQVQSLGAKFVMDPDVMAAQAETSGGYAREMDESLKQKQAALIAGTIGAQDIVVTTALIPGRPAPRLVNADMVARMKPGSVIVDISTSQGGNVEGSRADEVIVTPNGVTIIGYQNMPARIPYDASALYARNLTALLGLIVKDAGETLALSDEDEIIKGMTRDERK